MAGTGVCTPEVEIEVLQSVFHLPIEQAAKRLGMCVTVLKRICRSHGIARWPYRKVGLRYQEQVPFETPFLQTRGAD